MVAFEALSFYELSVNVNDNDDDHRRSVLIVFSFYCTFFGNSQEHTLCRGAAPTSWLAGNTITSGCTGLILMLMNYLGFSFYNCDNDN